MGCLSCINWEITNTNNLVYFNCSMHSLSVNKEEILKSSDFNSFCISSGYEMIWLNKDKKKNISALLFPKNGLLLSSPEKFDTFYKNYEIEYLDAVIVQYILHKQEVCEKFIGF